MKKRILLVTFLLVAVMVMANVLLVEGSPTLRPGQGANSASGGGCSATATITPNVSLPDGDPTYTCFDMVLSADPSATVLDVEVVVGHTHTWVGDLAYQIWNPALDHVTMMHRPGRTGAGFGDSTNMLSTSPVTFGDAYVDDAELMGNTLGDAQVVCQDDGRCTYFANRDEDLTSLIDFAAMAGSTVTGTWQFCASDNAGGDTGPLSTVTLNVTCAQPEIAIDKSPAAQTVVSGGNANFTITVTNTGTVTLTGVAVTDAAVPACDSAIGTLAPGATNT
ncbi:MAG: DUF11 domain-containing protein, partial [Chloroflexi bacterium]|nr:DUF11 domain-containing protein [Chloroflexota bacterium]